MAARKGYNRQPLMTDEHRGKIANSNILNALIEHVDGKRDMSATQVSAGIALLKKVMPDLQAVQHSGQVEHVNASEMSDDEIVRILRARTRNGTAAPAPDPSKLN